eukprot:TRINITY_DN1321_c0_g1_i1.p1 TRINITY_DN1321_c0_g1~~TRINITY_DN1321_c0_g1_i1.p1  ORF type:complete len:282 (-),score=54.17 TRINITY_DN1321_c0_g1_i1:209-1054(-)
MSVMLSRVLLASATTLTAACSSSSYSRVGNIHFRNEWNQQRDALVFWGSGPHFRFTECEMRCSQDDSCKTMEWQESAEGNECSLYRVEYGWRYDWVPADYKTVLYKKECARLQAAVSEEFLSAFAPDHAEEEEELPMSVKVNMTEMPEMPGLRGALRGGDWRSQMLSYVNKLRDGHGLRRVCLNEKLSRAAQAQSDSGVYEHTFNYIEKENYEWPRLGQNIASGHGTVFSVMAAWYNEQPPHDGHRRNILNPAFDQMGVGWDSSRNLWTQNFGSSRSEPCQ